MSDSTKLEKQIMRTIVAILIRAERTGRLPDEEPDIISLIKRRKRKLVREARLVSDPRYSKGTRKT